MFFWWNAENVVNLSRKSEFVKNRNYVIIIWKGFSGLGFIQDVHHWFWTTLPHQLVIWKTNIFNIGDYLKVVRAGFASFGRCQCILTMEDYRSTVDSPPLLFRVFHFDWCGFLLLNSPFYTRVNHSNRCV